MRCSWLSLPPLPHNLIALGGGKTPQMSLIDFQRPAQLDASPPCSSCSIFLPASTPQCFCRTKGSGQRRCTSGLRHWQEDGWKEREIGRLSIRKASLHLLTEADDSQNSEDDERNNSVQEKNLVKLLYFHPFLCYRSQRLAFLPLVSCLFDFLENWLPYA